MNETAGGAGDAGDPGELAPPALGPDAAGQMRELAPRVLGAVVRKCGDFAAAEDAVQDALLAATLDWPRNGVPQNAGGWLFHVACRRLADANDAEQARRRREAIAAAEFERNNSPPRNNSIQDLDELADGADDTLQLLLLSCHPALTPPSAIALTLRAVGGLTTAEIAAAYFVPEATMAQRISRAKQQIQTSRIPFAMPAAAERDARLASVLHVLYLMFNEGHTSSSGPELLRVDLSDEAIRLAQLLHRLAPDHAEAAGLLALLLLTDARRAARTGPMGELIPLQEQNRQLWDRAKIAEGTALITNTLARGSIGAYQLQAAIAALHDEAPSVTATDWPQILALYGLLRKLADNPMVELNCAIAAAMVHGPAEGLARIDALEKTGKLAEHFRIDAVRAHLHELAGDRAAALQYFRTAAEGTANQAERNYLLGKAAALIARERGAP
jgi:predicted RNA polymerase sigma factor